LEEEEQKQRAAQQNKATSPPTGDGEPSADQQFLKLMNVVCVVALMYDRLLILENARQFLHSITDSNLQRLLMLS